MTCTKIQASLERKRMSFHLDSDASIRLYTSFECQVKVHIESSVCTVSDSAWNYSTNFDCSCKCPAAEVKQERKKTDEEYLVNLLSYSTHE